MAATSTKPKIARGLNSLYAQARKTARAQEGAPPECDFGFIASDPPGEHPGSVSGSPQPIGDADLKERLAQFFASNTILPSGLWPTDTLRRALASFLQSLDAEANASTGRTGRDQDGAFGAHAWS